MRLVSLPSIKVNDVTLASLVPSNNMKNGTCPMPNLDLVNFYVLVIIRNLMHQSIYTVTERPLAPID